MDSAGMVMRSRHSRGASRARLACAPDGRAFARHPERSEGSSRELAAFSFVARSFAALRMTGAVLDDEALDCSASLFCMPSAVFTFSITASTVTLSTQYGGLQRIFGYGVSHGYRKHGPQDLSA